MIKILALAGSNSKNSINQQLIDYVLGYFPNQEVKKIALTDYELPIYGIDHENEKGYPVNAKILSNIIDEHDALIISVNQHNGTVSTVFKNAIDWLSRVNRHFLVGKKVLLMSTSTGPNGGAAALEYTKKIIPSFGAEIVDSFSFPSFKENFDSENQTIPDEILKLGLAEVVTNFEHQLQMEEKS